MQVEALRVTMPGGAAGPGAPPPTPAEAPPPPPPEAPSDLPEGWEEAPDPTTGTAAGRQVVRLGVGLARLGGAASLDPLVGHPGCSVASGGEGGGGSQRRAVSVMGSSGAPPRRSAREKVKRPHACHPGVTYYFNPSTKQTQWTKPTSVKG